MDVFDFILARAHEISTDAFVSSNRDRSRITVLFNNCSGFDRWGGPAPRKYTNPEAVDAFRSWLVETSDFKTESGVWDVFHFGETAVEVSYTSFDL